jgi:hypothetical protein
MLLPKVIGEKRVRVEKCGVVSIRLHIRECTRFGKWMEEGIMTLFLETEDKQKK